MRSGMPRTRGKPKEAEKPTIGAAIEWGTPLAKQVRPVRDLKRKEERKPQWELG